MGTHCYIAIEDADGQVRYIFCHLDGYLRSIVPILKLDYMTREDVDALVRGGGRVTLNRKENAVDSNGSPMETVADRWAFQNEWKNQHSIQYMYLFNEEDEWECYCNTAMTFDCI